jgi:hypothetical protein
MLASEERQSLLAQHKPNCYKEAASRSFNELNPQEQAQVIDIYRDLYDA